MTGWRLQESWKQRVHINVTWHTVLQLLNFKPCHNPSPVTEKELKKHSGEFDLECIDFLDLSDRGIV